MRQEDLDVKSYPIRDYDLSQQKLNSGSHFQESTDRRSLRIPTSFFEIRTVNYAEGWRPGQTV